MVLGKTRPVTIEEEMRHSYLAYAMSVIVSRALPDVRDGLKPVQRRILYAMNDMGITHAGSFKKSARIVGEVLGKYHPHGDTSVYDAMVRLAQDFSMRYRLVDGQGNFGSIDNDPPAAMRYTEARLTELAEQMLLDIDKETVDFIPNFDDSLKEPTVLPSRLPNLLVNGSSGIAVGMATNIPPHNLGEICDAISFMIDNPAATVEELMRFVKGPDFPTGGVILGQEGIKSAYATGHGRITVQAKAHIADSPDTGRWQIIVNEIPFQTNKASLVERIANLASEKKIVGIGEVRDESDRQGMRIVIEIKRDAQPQQVLNNLYKHTAMQTAFTVNMLTLVDGQPRVLSLRETLQSYIDFRRTVIIRRSQFELKGAKARAHILEGLKIALDNIDAVINTIRQSESAEKARQALMSQFSLSQLQAQAILDMQLRRLASLERNKIMEEYAAVLKTIAYLEEILANPRRVLMLIRDEITELKTKYGDERRTEISSKNEVEFSEEDLIPHEQMVVTVSDRGFIKRTSSQVFSVQHRGGKGLVAMVTRDNDFVRHLSVADTHDSILFFTNRGKVFRVKCHEVPQASSRAAKGIAAINFFPIGEGEAIAAVVPVSDFAASTCLLMATRMGEVKKTAVGSFTAVRSSGLIAMSVEEKDEFVSARMAKEDDDVVMVTERGQSIRFQVSSVRTSLRTSGGVCGIKLGEGDRVVSMDVADPQGLVLVVTTNGVGKLSPVSEYPQQKRAGSGVITIKLTDKTGEVAAARIVSLTNQLMIISAEGNIIYTPVKERDPKMGIPILGRSTQGVRIMKMNEGDRVVAVTAFDKPEK